MEKKRNQRWSQEERAALLDAVQECRTQEGKIDWSAVAARSEGRSKLQLKSFYQNVLAPAERREEAERSQWGIDRTLTLKFAAMTYKKDWAMIRTLYFPECTARQLAARFRHSMRILERHLVVAEQIMGGLVAQLPQKDVFQLFNFFRIMQWRLDNLRLSMQYDANATPPPCPAQLRQFGEMPHSASFAQFPPDPLEIKLLQFFENNLPCDMAAVLERISAHLVQIGVPLPV